MSARKTRLGPINAHEESLEEAGALYTLKSDGSVARGAAFPEDGARGVSGIEKNLFCVLSYGATYQQDVIATGGHQTNGRFRCVKSAKCSAAERRKDV